MLEIVNLYLTKKSETKQDLKCRFHQAIKTPFFIYKKYLKIKLERPYLISFRNCNRPGTASQSTFAPKLSATARAGTKVLPLTICGGTSSSIATPFFFIVLLQLS